MDRPSNFGSRMYRTEGAEVCSDSTVELVNHLWLRRRFEAEQRCPMHYGAEALTHLTGDTLCGRVRRDERRVLGFQCLELLHQGIVRRIADGRPVQGIVPIVVVANLLPQVFHAADDPRARRPFDLGRSCVRT
jgi:hypothetical protein